MREVLITTHTDLTTDTDRQGAVSRVDAIPQDRWLRRVANAFTAVITTHRAWRARVTDATVRDAAVHARREAALDARRDAAAIAHFGLLPR